MLAGEPVVVIETRSAADLAGILHGRPRGVLVADLARNPIRILEDLAISAASLDDWSTLVLDPNRVVVDRRRLGTLPVTHLATGFAVPQEVAGLVLRWAGLLQRRDAPAGWVGPWAEDEGAPWRLGFPRSTIAACPHN
jgi:hypothetical protein